VQAALMFSLLAHPVLARPLVQPAGLPKIHVFQLGTRHSSAHGPPALRLVLSILLLFSTGASI